MVNASEHYKKEGKFNVWNQEETIKAYEERKEIEGFSGYVELADLEENDFNLSVQRYIFKEEPEEEIDIVELMNEIKETEKVLEEDKKIMEGIMSQIIALQTNNKENA